ncbi:MAG: serine/threonine protein kinase [Nitrosomonas sp.]|uniref:serine/threonine protein kinase n=1 Tax=Nitrosomonas sp. TaxID=42353 RepID=UPI0027327E76|nr:serine/threonine protein kinase [Nitrosomonas sp.]MDP3282333.1 serine/threonine protein kinase [Nitrosomonas sp.]MDP3661966.1 serine/threonine protein kinase [Nitrosomonas sp.]MDZ4106395.1 serine/threonine protein kinase [Nitrosomonas sp.]
MTLAFSLLTPDCVMNALDSLGCHSDGRLLALNSYENRVYQVGMEEGLPLVAKFYRPGRWTNEAILEEHAFVQELAEREIPVVPALVLGGKTLHTFEGFRFAVFPKHGGRAPEFDDRNTLEWMGRFLGRIHAIGALKPFQHRPTLDIASFGVEPLDFLMINNFIPADLDIAYRSVAEQALAGVHLCFERAGKHIKTLRLHGDCHAGNVLWTDSGPHFVDFDDSRMGPAVQDLWMLLSGERTDMVRQLNDVLAGYEDFCDFDANEVHLIEALRTLRLIHYSAWLAQRWNDPAFKQAFPWFNTQRYWQERILELREQIALMDEPLLGGCPRIE